MIESLAWSTTTPLAADITWSFVKKNWDDVFSARYSTGFLIMDLVKVNVTIQL